MGFRNYLISKLNWQFRKKFFRIWIFLWNLIVLKMSFDSIIESIWQFFFLLNFLKSIELRLNFFISSITAINHLNHVSNHVWIESNSTNHPDIRKDLFREVTCWYITISYCCKSLKGPMKRNHILSSCRRIIVTGSYNPSIIREFLKFV